ncbi:hypothetical protein MNEG_8709 [Monoraphidium neglectum]|jgi:N-glycosylase/DNA lyase|uniref:8-oxoguanine DNA glycosylase N-terminal domain-containing protein n=1 Tax=Monoraphidium neglectum TaxID=145388 RepID=A0A0D2M7B1_9CHLO|nr:hypothetical protein MNEG_8709 [Monoraphidium neglectum]KIY99249.1 hypothetical protein MNEG_8709 [Monoraphidium neglectum]|eukprot:XP_013898269.1 hypothetical protein MNEG_8709 [Monoraphidium neglectum]
MRIATAAAGPTPHPQQTAAAADAAPAVAHCGAVAWRRLGTPRRELTLDFTLPTGQSFRWRRTASGEFTGVIGRRVVSLRQEADDVAWRVVARGAGLPDDAGADEAALADYFNLGVDLAALYKEWAAADARFAQASVDEGNWRASPFAICSAAV